MSDDFSARYRLLKCVLVEDGIRTHNAQELASGRVVMVHITDAAGPEEVDALRALLSALPSVEQNKVLEAVTLTSGFAVVTEFLTAPLTFRSWLAANAVSAPTVPAVPGSSATIPMPDVSIRADGAVEPLAMTNETASAVTDVPPAVTAPAIAPVTAPVTAAAVEAPPAAPLHGFAESFSAIFGNPAPSAPAAVEYPLPSASHIAVDLASDVPPPPTAPAEPPVMSPMMSPVAPPVTAPVPPTVAPPVAAPVPPPAAPPVAPPVFAPVASSPAPKPEPGEFTRMFSPTAEHSASNASVDPVLPLQAPPVLPPPVAAPPVLPPSVLPPPVFAPIASPPPVAAAPVPPASVPATPVPFAPVPATPVPFAPPAVAPAAAAPPPAPLPVPPSPLSAAASMGFLDDAPAPAAPRQPPGEFTKLFGAPETAAPMPDAVRSSPMRQAPPPAFSPLTPERPLESPPVEPMHRVMTSNPNYVAGIHQDGLSPIAPDIVGGGRYAGLPPLMPVTPPPAPPAHVSPLFAAAGPPSGETPPPGLGILPPPIFSSGTSTPLSALGGAAPLVNASAGPSEFTRLISSAAEPVLPPLAPTNAITPGRGGASSGRRLPQGLIITINAVLLIAALLMWFVLRRPIPTVQQVMPAKPVMPTMPNTPQIPR